MNNAYNLKGFWSVFLRCVLICVVLAGTLAGCQPASVTLQPTSVSNVIPLDLGPEQIVSIGVISDDPAGTIAEFQPMADYLAQHLADQGIVRGRVIVAADSESVVSAMRSGEMDLFFESPYIALYVYEEAAAIPLLRRWKGGVGEYKSLIITRSTSELTTMDDLNGHIVGFEDPFSTSGYLLPVGHLVSLGYTLNEKATTGSGVGDSEIGYVFLNDIENIVAQLLAGGIDAGVLSNLDYDELTQAERDQLVILGETEYVPRHIVLASSTMSLVLQDAVKTVLTNMEENSEGRQVLVTFEETSQFDSFPVGIQETMQALQLLFAPVR